MTRIFSVSKDRIGRSPGTVEYLGKPKVETVTVQARVFGPDRLEVLGIEEVLAGAGAAKGEVLWIDVVGLHDTALLSRFGDRFGINPLVLEDIISANQRTKCEEYDGHLYVVARSTRYDVEACVAESEQVNIILAADTVVTFHERHTGVFDAVRERLEGGRGRLRTAGAGYLAYALLDAVADSHLLSLSQFGENVEALEDEMLERPDLDYTAAIHELKRELILLRRAVRPLRDMVATLARHETALLGAKVRPFMTDLVDHAIQAGEALDSFNEMLAGMHEYHQSTSGQKLNEVMKVLTIISTIFVPITFVAGIYGMNFAHMPELQWRWAYPALWGVVVAVAAGMLVFFRRRRWI